MSDYVAAPTRAGNGMAVAGLLLGIVGIFILNIILGPLAVIFGGVGWSRAKRGAPGRGMAVAGVVLGVVDILIVAGLLALAANNHGHFVWHI